MNTSEQNQFIQSVNTVPNSCWEWTGARFKRGYGQISSGPERCAHRRSFELFVGPIPQGKVIRHLCNNPPCVNPIHLAVGTMADNYQDSVDAGTAPFGERNGHAKHSIATVRKIRKLKASGMNHCAIGRKLNIHRMVVSDIVNGKRRRNG